MRCLCNKEAVLKVVHKEGPNTGKAFWGCASKPYCAFFKWKKDEDLMAQEPEAALHQKKEKRAREDSPEIPSPPHTPRQNPDEGQVKNHLERIVAALEAIAENTKRFK